MLSSMFDSTTIPVLEQVVNFTEARHGVLAGNVANLDTPGYRTRDLSPELFRERLQEAVEAQHAQPSSTYGSAERYGPLDHNRAMDAFRDVKESMKSILFHDNSDVSLERQVTEIAKNQLEHDLAVSIMSAQFRLLRTAISERLA
jgi:flagellar basal-body rod protein FlgB